MLVAFTFAAKPGKEKEFETLLNNPEMGRHAAKLFGASRNTLFLGNGRMVRILEFAEGVKPVPVAEAAKTDAGLAQFLRTLGPLVENGFDYDTPGSLEAFNKRMMLPVAFDVSA